MIFSHDRPCVRALPLVLGFSLPILHMSGRELSLLCPSFPSFGNWSYEGRHPQALIPLPSSPRFSRRFGTSMLLQRNFWSSSLGPVNAEDQCSSPPPSKLLDSWSTSDPTFPAILSLPPFPE